MVLISRSILSLTRRNLENTPLQIRKFDILSFGYHFCCVPNNPEILVPFIYKNDISHFLNFLSLLYTFYKWLIYFLNYLILLFLIKLGMARGFCISPLIKQTEFTNKIPLISIGRTFTKQIRWFGKNSLIFRSSRVGTFFI